MRFTWKKKQYNKIKIKPNKKIKIQNIILNNKKTIKNKGKYYKNNKKIKRI
jgi:hypothetical protein